jgi:hypothetical protein
MNPQRDKLIYYSKSNHELNAKGIDDVENPIIYKLGETRNWRHILGNDWSNENFKFEGQMFENVNDALKIFGQTRLFDILLAKFTQIPIARKILIQTLDAELYGTKDKGFPERNIELEKVRDKINKKSSSPRSTSPRSPSRSPSPRSTSLRSTSPRSPSRSLSAPRTTPKKSPISSPVRSPSLSPKITITSTVIPSTTLNQRKSPQKVSEVIIPIVTKKKKISSPKLSPDEELDILTTKVNKMKIKSPPQTQSLSFQMSSMDYSSQLSQMSVSDLSKMLTEKNVKGRSAAKTKAQKIELLSQFMSQ